MDDLISRQAIIDAHYDYCNEHQEAAFPVWSLKLMQNAPSAQPEAYDSQKEVAKYVTAFSDGYDRGKADAQPEIVRCKDCKHAPTGYEEPENERYPIFPDACCPCRCYEDEWYSYIPNPEFYCCRGERKNETD